MTKYKLSKRSVNNMKGINPKLQVIIGLMLDRSPYDFIVTEGLRTEERQRMLVDTGKSKTMKSYHLRGNAFDIAIINEKGNVTWDSKYYKEFADVVYKLASRLGFSVTWGGSWRSFKDCPHFQVK